MTFRSSPIDLKFVGELQGKGGRNDSTKRVAENGCGSCGSGAVRNCWTFDGHTKGVCFLARCGPSSTTGNVYDRSIHSFAYFGGIHHIVGLVRGRFDKVTGTISAAKEPADCALDISVDTASLDTQFARRDEDLRGPDFFDVKNFPAMTYRGRGIRQPQMAPG